MSEMTEAIAAIQAAQADTVAATKALVDHNIDLEAHPDIRELLDRLINGEAIYTRSEINKLIEIGLKAHADTPFDEAHPGWSEYNTATQNTLNSLSDKIDALEIRLDKAEGTGDMTDLQRQLQAVEDRYAPIIAGLQTSFSAAEKNGQTALATEYMNSISRTLDQKKDDLLKVMSDWQATHSAT